jgi:Gly-Xaa carboxypeptidase
MAHQDAVPVSKETLSRWTYSPFEGAIDEREEFVWGRGAADCKSLLMAEYEALALLLQQGWTPRRSVILAHGYDEETSGLQGALKISEHLEQSYGRDSMLMVIDEGMESERFYGTAFALPATTEKGYLNVEIAVGTPGGHSSVPPAHTGIGILSEIVKAVEGGHYAAGFDGARDPILQFQLCAEKYTSEYPKAWRKLIKSRNWKGLAKAWADYKPSAKGGYTTGEHK